MAAEGLWSADDGMACDCHSHLYGPFARFPLPPSDHHDAAEKTLGDYEALAQRLGVGRTVFVQPLAYGADHAAMLAAMRAKGPDRAKGIAVADLATPLADLEALAVAGVRGVRVMTSKLCPLSPNDALAMTERVAPLGWHLQIQGEGSEIEDWADLFANTPVPIVIDHMGRLPTGDGLSGRPFGFLLRLLESGNVWVKLSAFYYGFVPGGDPMAEVAQRVRTLVAERPDRLVWGLNWPHPAFAEANKPDDVALFRAFLSWLPSPASARAILADNPARLYGFS